MFNTINCRDTTHFDSEDDYHTVCGNVSHCQQQQFYSDLIKNLIPYFRLKFCSPVRDKLLRPVHGS